MLTPHKHRRLTSKVMQLLNLLLSIFEVRILSYWFNIQGQTKTRFCNHQWQMALECGLIWYVFSIKYIFLLYVASINRPRLLLCVSWWYFNIQHFTERTPTVLTNLLQPSTCSKFKNSTQQIPFLATPILPRKLISGKGIQPLLDKILIITNKTVPKSTDELIFFFDLLATKENLYYYSLT